MSAARNVPKSLLERIVDDATTRFNATKEEVVLVRAEAVTWPDGGLGCPEPGMLYTQQLVEGYWVQLEIRGMLYDYRASKRGNFRRCVASDARPGTPSMLI